MATIQLSVLPVSTERLVKRFLKSLPVAWCNYSQLLPKEKTVFKNAKNLRKFQHWVNAQ